MAERSAIPESIGRYRILRLLGKGGMGAVFEAEQENPRRTVALKVVTAGALSEQNLRRFELEAQVLGYLQHPCIAQIYEAGVFDNDAGAQPFFAMELIRGVQLVRYAKERALGTRGRLELVARICDGVQHAHQRGVIHRDLKPENILVDGEGQPKILDFGLARATDADIEAVTLHTDMGQIMGTVPYMSPEQALGDPRAIDARSDVYSLGVVAYELVAGRMPYRVNDPNVLETLRVIREEDAKPLSSVNRSLRGDVETIIGKALEKEPERRYPYAAAMAEDIRRYLADEPIQARPPSQAYRVRKFVRRNKALVSGVAAVFVALVVGLLGTARGFLAARADAERARSAASFLQTVFRSVDPAIARESDTALLRSILDDSATRIESELSGRPLVAAMIHDAMAGAYHSIAEFESALEHAGAAREIYSGELGESSIEAITADGRMVMGLIELRRVEAYEEALRHLERAGSALGSDHSAADMARSMVGSILLNEERFDEAETLYREVLAYRKQHYGPGSREVLSALSGLGLALLGQRRFDDARPLLEDALAGRLQTLGETHPETMQAVENLAGLHETRQEYAEAEALYRETLERQRRILGENHERTLVTMRNLGNLLRETHRIEEALEVKRILYETRLARNGADDRRTLKAEGELGLLYRLAGRMEEAETHGRHAYEGLLAVLGPDHLNTLGAKVNLLATYGEDSTNDVLVEEMSLELIDSCSRALGTDHQTTLMVMSDLGVLYKSQKRRAEAEPLLRRVLDARQRVLGSDHHETLQSVGLLGLLLSEDGRPEESLPLCGEFLHGWSSLYGYDHAYLYDVAREVVRQLRRVERLGPHEASIRALLAYQERTLPEGDGEVSSSLTYLAQSLLDQRRADEARQALKTAREPYAERGEPPPAHWVAAAALADLVPLEEAEELLIREWESAAGLSSEVRRPIAWWLASLNDLDGRPDEASYWREQVR